MNDDNILEMYRPTKSKRKCAFCTSRSCYERVFTRDGIFDELACRRHVRQLHRLSDIHLPGVTKVFQSSTGYQKRGDAQREFDECEKIINKFKPMRETT